MLDSLPYHNKFMDSTLRQNIIDELTTLLKRAPNEQEIMNGQTDSITMGKIRDKEIAKKVDKK